MRPQATPPGRRTRPLVWSSTALGAAGAEAGDVRLSRLDRLLRRLPPTLVLHAGDALAAGGAVVGALWGWGVVAGNPLTWSYLLDHAAWFGLPAVWLLILRAASAARLPASSPDHAAIVARAVVAGIGLYLAAYFLAPRDLLPRLVVLYFLGFAGLGTLVWRVAHRRLFATDARESPVAVIGAGSAARDIAALLAELAPHRKVLGMFAAGEREPAEGPDRPAAELQRLIAGRRVSALVLAPEGRMGDDMLRSVVAAHENGVDVLPMHAVYEELLRRLPVRHKEAAWVLESLTEARRRGAAFSMVKRAVDITGGVVGCLLLLAALPVLVPLVWLDVGWPVLFRQERLGLAGQPFRLLKFRTMGADAEPDGPRWAETEDARASRFGRFLRRSRLDELPQFWNVLRGQMSLVGPRPERPEFVAELSGAIPCYRERLRVRPGISGWAQVNYRYGGSVDGALDKLEYDLYYVRHRSFWLDTAIVWRTLWTVLSLGGR